MSENDAPSNPSASNETPPPPTAGSSNRGLMIALSYLWLLSLIPLLTEKDDTEVQWHAKHGLVLFGAEIILFLILSVLMSIPVFGCIIMPIWMILIIAVIVVHIVSIVKGVNGERFTIPHISQYADRF